MTETETERYLPSYTHLAVLQVGDVVTRHPQLKVSSCTPLEDRLRSVYLFCATLFLLAVAAGPTGLALGLIGGIAPAVLLADCMLLRPPPSTVAFLFHRWFVDEQRWALVKRAQKHSPLLPLLQQSDDEVLRAVRAALAEMGYRCE